jgi:flavodoxin
MNKTLILYDSAYGNTQKVADAMAAAVSSQAVAIGQVSTDHLPPADLLIVGSPTQAGRPTSGMKQFLDQIPAGRLSETQVAAFDTRFEAQQQSFGLRTLMKVLGYAAPRIASALTRKGARLVAPPEGFIVEDKEGPLKPGEADRAASWAKALSRGGG